MEEPKAKINVARHEPIPWLELFLFWTAGPATSLGCCFLAGSIVSAEASEDSADEWRLLEVLVLELPEPTKELLEDTVPASSSLSSEFKYVGSASEEEGENNGRARCSLRSCGCVDVSCCWLRDPGIHEDASIGEASGVPSACWGIAIRIGLRTLPGVKPQPPFFLLVGTWAFEKTGSEKFCMKIQATCDFATPCSYEDGAVLKLCRE